MNVYEKALRDLFGKSEELKDIKYTGRTCLDTLFEQAQTDKAEIFAAPFLISD